MQLTPPSSVGGLLLFVRSYLHKTTQRKSAIIHLIRKIRVLSPPLCAFAPLREIIHTKSPKKIRVESLYHLIFATWPLAPLSQILLSTPIPTV